MATKSKEELQAMLDCVKENLAVVGTERFEMQGALREAISIYNDLLAERTVTNGRLRNALDGARRATLTRGET